MIMVKESRILVENLQVQSTHLARKVKVDCYLPTNVSAPEDLELLLINDGQDLERMGFKSLLAQLYDAHSIRPVLCVGIHAGPERRMEYGIAGEPDFKGRGAKAALYTRFILEELIPLIQETYHLHTIRQKSFAGFSLGGLAALDIVWNHPHEFSIAAVFSGSLWWRSKDQHDNTYDDDSDRIMHQLIRKGKKKPGLQFFFECGMMDEQRDRNQNGIIDSIDDTLDLIEELRDKGYPEKDIEFLLLEDGKHDVETWGRAMPVFMKWAFAR
jgi:enterochelin esterase-like enzyme